jgi:uncharacterized protein
MNKRTSPSLPELDEATRTQILQVAAFQFALHPPTIGIIGASGVGKSLTLNTIFKTELPIGHAVTYTKEFLTGALNVSIPSGELAGQAVRLRVIGAPALGEDIALDPMYLAMYRKHLPECDVILWVLTARNRAIALDQSYLQSLLEVSDRMIFGINQIDLVEPLNWNHKLNAPSPEQLANIAIIQQDRKAKIEAIVNREMVVIPYSARQKFNLQPLFTGLIEACLPGRAWLFNVIKNFSYLDFLPESAREVVAEKMRKKQVQQ